MKLSINKSRDVCARFFICSHIEKVIQKFNLILTKNTDVNLTKTGAILTGSIPFPLRFTELIAKKHFIISFISMPKVYKQCQSCGMPMKMDKK